MNLFFVAFKSNRLTEAAKRLGFRVDELKAFEKDWGQRAEHDRVSAERNLCDDWARRRVERLTQAARLVGQLVQPCADGHPSEKSADKRENEKQAHGRTSDQELIKSTRPRVSGCAAAARTKLSRWRSQRAPQQYRPSKVLRRWP